MIGQKLVTEAAAREEEGKEDDEEVTTCSNATNPHDRERERNEMNGIHSRCSKNKLSCLLNSSAISSLTYLLYRQRFQVRVLSVCLSPSSNGILQHEYLARLAASTLSVQKFAKILHALFAWLSLAVDRIIAACCCTKTTNYSDSCVFC